MKFHYIQIIFLSELLLTPSIVVAKELTAPSTHFQKVVKTAKERLGKKASDQQRINNCKVPIKLRGSKPRPDQCHNIKRNN